MDTAVADTINRLDAARIAKHLDLLDWFAGPGIQWATSIIGRTLASEDPATNSDRAWLVGALAAHTPDVAFDGAPADCDWENFFGHLRTEIEARRNPQTSSVCAAEPPRGMV